jgi:hypothetical protein
MHPGTVRQTPGSIKLLRSDKRQSANPFFNKGKSELFAQPVSQGQGKVS